MIGYTAPQLELLSPAGDWEKLRMAVLYGADAVYLGSGAFTMRARSGAVGFEGEALPEAVAFCHEKGVKVYLTCNSLPHCDEVGALEEYLPFAAAAGVDALIVADIGVLAAARRLVPALEMHISTQMGVVNHLTAAALYEMGASRVVLARELSLKEIHTIRQKTPPALELEAFVHGAMCMSVSGRCLLSQYLTGRDANRGQCTQPCRWSWRLVEERRPGEYFPIGQSEGDEAGGKGGSYILNARDLCMIDDLDALRDAGVSSFKIEGRAKSAYYTAVITGAYRAALDALAAGNPVPPWAVEETLRVSHRPYSTGFYLGPPQDGQYTQDGGYIREWDVVAVAQGWEDGCLIVSQRGRFFKGDTLEVLQPGRSPYPLCVESIQDEAGVPIDVARHAMMILRLPGGPRLEAGSLLRKRREGNA